jgi:hypothetical protein
MFEGLAQIATIDPSVAGSSLGLNRELVVL